MTAFTLDEHTALIIVEVVQCILVAIIFTGIKDHVHKDVAIEAFREGYLSKRKEEKRNYVVKTNANIKFNKPGIYQIEVKEK